MKDSRFLNKSFFPVMFQINQVLYMNQRLYVGSIFLIVEMFCTDLSCCNLFAFSFTRKLKNNPIKCTCKLKSDLSDESIKNKIADLNDIQCVNINKSVLAAITDVNCGINLFHYSFTFI